MSRRVYLLGVGLALVARKQSVNPSAARTLAWGSCGLDPLTGLAFVSGDGQSRCVILAVD